MTSRLDHDRKSAAVMHLSARVIAAILSLPLLLAGCDGAGEAADGSAPGLTNQLAAFVADFARQTLAAWLL